MVPTEGAPTLTILSIVAVTRRLQRYSGHTLTILSIVATVTPRTGSRAAGGRHGSALLRGVHESGAVERMREGRPWPRELPRIPNQG